MSFYAALESTVLTYVLLDYISQWFIILAEFFLQSWVWIILLVTIYSACCGLTYSVRTDVRLLKQAFMLPDFAKNTWLR